MAEEKMYVSLSGGLPVEVTKAAYEEVWKDKGFTEVSKEEAIKRLVEAEATAAPKGELDTTNMTKEQLQAEAEKRGLATSGTKDELIARLAGAEAQQV